MHRTPVRLPHRQRRTARNDRTGESSWAAYRHNHLIGAVAGERFFGRAAKTWKDLPRDEAIGTLSTDVSADNAALESIVDGFGLSVPACTKGFAWTGRTRILGPVNRYTPGPAPPNNWSPKP